MTSVAKAIPLFAILCGCAQSGTDLESLDKNKQNKMDANLAGSWTSFTGELVKGGVPFCNGTYLGTSSQAAGHTVEAGASLTDEGTDEPEHLFLTSLHCISNVNIKNISIQWANGAAVGQVTGVYGVGDPTKSRLDDVAVLYIAPPSGVTAFSPRLAAKGGSSNVLIRVPKPSKDLTKSLLVLGILDGKKKNTLCETTVVDRKEAGFTIQCTGIEGNPEGLSGALIVTLKGEPVGVFKGKVPGNRNLYVAHALAFGSIGRGIGTLANDDNTMTTVLESFSGTASCKGSIAAACLGDKDQDAVFDNNASLKSLISCTNEWTSKTVAGKSNADICSFKDPSQNGMGTYNRLLEIFGKDDKRGCTTAPQNSACTDGTGCQPNDLGKNMCIDPASPPSGKGRKKIEGGCLKCELSNGGWG